MPLFDNISQLYTFYPSSDEIDIWCENLLQKSRTIKVEGTYESKMPVTEPFGNGPNALINKYIKFTMPDGHTFWGYWQPALNSPAPLLINLPGYGGCINLHPQLSDDGFHVLHISPLGYVTPDDICKELQTDTGYWPVLQNTALGESGGYEDWILDCLAAFWWAKRQPEILADRISFYGTSQGGGGSLLLSSILQKEVRCVCADLPFLTNFPLTHLQGEAYGLLQAVYPQVEEKTFWNRLGYFDTISHAHRIKIPTMISSGGKDSTCPSSTVQSLFEKLDCTKQYTYIQNLEHTHSRESMFLFRNWLKMYA